MIYTINTAKARTIPTIEVEIPYLNMLGLRYPPVTFSKQTLLFAVVVTLQYR